MIDNITTFFSGNPIMIWISGIGSILFILNVIIIFKYIYNRYFTGLLNTLYRLSYNITKQKIAIYSKNNSLENLIKDSKLFRNENIVKIESDNDLNIDDDITMMLIDYNDFKNELELILNKKKRNNSLIIYCPYDYGRIDDDIMNNIDKTPYSIVTNFRGRLINDIFISMLVKK